MKVLVAYDGSAGGHDAIADLRLAGLPENTDAIVMTVADLPSALLAPASPDDPNLKLFRRARARANEMMAHARESSLQGAESVKNLFPAWHVRAEAVADSPYWAFITSAHQQGADLIVVGSRGLKGVMRTLGSVSQNIVHHAPCSVRVARTGRGTHEDGPVKLLLGFDGSAGAAEALASIRLRTWPAGTQLHIVTAVDDRMLYFMLADLDAANLLPPMTTTKDERTYLARTIEIIRNEMQAAGLVVTTVIRKGDPKKVLIAEAKKWGADCIFVGARGLSRIERALLGSVSGSVVARAHCSVEVVRSQPGIALEPQTPATRA